MDEANERIRAAIKHEQYELAVSLLNQALARVEGDELERLRGLRSYVYQLMGRHDLVLDELGTRLAAEPADAAALFEKADALLEAGRFAEALAALQEVTAADLADDDDDDDDSVVLMMQAICLNRLGRPDEATAVLQGVDPSTKLFALGRLWSVADGRLCYLGVNR